MPQILYNNISIGKRQIGPSIQEGEFLIPSTLAGFKRPAVPITRTPPQIVQPPQLSGFGVIPATLTAFPGVYTGSPQPTYTYEWLRNGIPFANVGNTYVTQAADDGAKFAVRVTATSPSGTIITTSNTITAVLYEEQVVNDWSTYIITGQAKYGNIMGNGTDAFWITGMAQQLAQINSSFATYSITGMGQENTFMDSSFATYSITGMGQEDTFMASEYEIYTITQGV